MKESLQRDIKCLWMFSVQENPYVSIVSLGPLLGISQLKILRIFDFTSILSTRNNERKIAVKFWFISC